MKPESPCEPRALVEVDAHIFALGSEQLLCCVLPSKFPRGFGFGGVGNKAHLVQRCVVKGLQKFPEIFCVRPASGQ